MPLIDCDVHIRWKDTDEFAMYLAEPWRSRLKDGYAPFAQNGYPNPIGVRRKDAAPPSGGSAGSDPYFTLEQLVERYDMDYAVLVGESLHLTVSNLTNPHWASALASAYNDWIVHHWLTVDERYLGSIIVATQDPEAAAREIERMADHPQFVQVILGSGARFPYGQKYYYPIYAAAERHGLPVAIHGFTEGAGLAGAPTAAGYPSYFIEYHTAVTGSLQAHIISLLCEGTFESFPGLRFLIIEGGVAWLPSLLWRLDKNWKSLRSEVPWVKRRPSAYAADHLCLSTQPLEEPDTWAHMLQILEMFPSDRMLLFASDYPHWDFDDPTHILKKLPSSLRDRVAHLNARELYGLN